MLLPIQDENPTYSKPVITVALLAANVMVFIYQMILGPAGEQLFIFGTAVIPSPSLLYMSYQKEFGTKGGTITIRFMPLISRSI